jgi:hypothetical protein
MVDYAGGAKGAAGGAATGAAIGSVVPGWGTAVGGVVGGVIGGLGGLFGGSSDPNAGAKAELQKKLQALADSYTGRQAPQIGQNNIAQGTRSDQVANQQGLISQLQAMANGTGPSAAAIQMREAMDRAAAAQTSAAAGAGGRGVNQGAAYLNAANNTAAIQAQGARDTATLRAQEQLNAVGQLGQNIQAARGADEAMGQFNAQQMNQANMANLQAQLQTLGLNDEGQYRALMGQLGMMPQGPDMGTSILAGGANVLPSLIQQSYARNQVGKVPPAQDYNIGQYEHPVTSPSEV